MTQTQPRRWDRSELPPLVDDLLTAAAALERWIAGEGIEARVAPAEPTTAAAVLTSRHKGDLSGPELSRILGVAHSTVSQWCRQGVLSGCYMVPGSRSPKGMWMVPLDEAKEAAGFTSALRTANPRISDRSVAIAVSKHMRETKGMPSLGRKGRRAWYASQRAMRAVS